MKKSDTVEKEKNIDFTGVEICNNNKYKKSNITKWGLGYKLSLLHGKNKKELSWVDEYFKN